MHKPYTTAGRLELYRQRAAKNKYGRNDWRTHKCGNTWNYEWHSGIREDGLILTDNRDTLGEYLGDWHEFSGGARYLRDTNGFYTDSYCSKTMSGGVVRLRTARFTMYIPCTYRSDWDGASLYYRDAERVPRNATESDHETAAHEAARMAYQWAEREAEIAREDDVKYRASEDIERARAEIHNTNRQALALLAEIKGNQYTDNVCAALRHRLQDFLTDRKRQFKVIEERTENFWSAVPY